MTPMLPYLLIAIAALVVLACICRHIAVRRTREKLSALMHDLYRGRLEAIQGFPLTEDQAKLLFAPFTEDMLRHISRCRECGECRLFIEFQGSPLTFFGIYDFAISCTFSETKQPELYGSQCIEGRKHITPGVYRRLWKPLLRHAERLSRASIQ